MFFDIDYGYANYFSISYMCDGYVLKFESHFYLQMIDMEGFCSQAKPDVFECRTLLRLDPIQLLGFCPRCTTNQLHFNS